MPAPANDVTRTLSGIRGGDPEAASELVELVYAPLRALAGQYLRRQPSGHTLQPTALVHEVFVRLVGGREVDWHGRAHFFAVCATAMRGILADHARRRLARRRGGDRRRVTLSDLPVDDGTTDLDVLQLDEVLSRLEKLDERQARVVEYRFFAGMTIPEVATALGVSERTVNSDWTMARAWLSARLSESA